MKAVYVIFSSLVWALIFAPVQQSITNSSGSILVEALLLGGICSAISLAIFFASDSFIQIRKGWKGVLQIILIPLIICILKLLSSQYYVSRFG